MTLHKDASSEVLNIALEKEGEKRKKVITTRGIRIWSPTQPRRTGLNFAEGTYHVAVLVV